LLFHWVSNIPYVQLRIVCRFLKKRRFLYRVSVLFSIEKWEKFKYFSMIVKSFPFINLVWKNSDQPSDLSFCPMNPFFLTDLNMCSLLCSVWSSAYIFLCVLIVLEFNEMHTSQGTQTDERNRIIIFMNEDWIFLRS
jgi:hypothetical protein